QGDAMSAPPHDPQLWGLPDRTLELFARNVSTRYLAIFIDGIIGLVMLPFNLAHLGASTYGLWVLVTSVTTYFSVLDMGYGSAQVKFAAQYRALRDTRAINEIASSIFFLFLGVAVVAYALVALVAFNIDRIFSLQPDQFRLGRDVLLIVGLYIALGFPFSTYGGIVNGFQRYYANNAVAIGTAIAAAVANLVVLMAGHGLLALVAATTGIRIVSLLLYRWNAYRAFPPLSVNWRLVRRGRLREVTGFSAYLLIISLAAKINVTADTMVIGAVVSTAAIAVWTVAFRLTDATRMVTVVLTQFLFPTVVDHAARNRLDRLREILVQATRLQLATCVPMASITAMLAPAIVLAWVGPRFESSVVLVYLLAALVIVRMGTHTARTVLMGTGQHKMVAVWSVVVALINLPLSIVLVRRYGLPGVAIGTLIPSTIVNLAVLFPAACRRIELPLSQALRDALWPTLWPAVLPCVMLFYMRPWIGTSVWRIVLAAAMAGIVYAMVFLGLAIANEERRWYVDKLRSLIRRPSALLPARL
ncbi:MAG TPA: oligosaccharide flippase family protein, partial [Vicinamibacterales bacterium]|nr:oligosaccharide flippase family protein [Vicinamibacterales bacterium]